ncbi:thioredoxin-related protein [Alkalibacillus filiformis]|uniref:Thioredoxin-related protein n=1 Tax=Alkalibacillus filiformis TaxID=200990 RepID=A0ABU0DQ30_9BACI|nr:hypothetical protein [Alkalibacillus filiformis]MDQ0350557.1 thioredoxin-related protein [Alkalibacillus filiformis]
MKLFFISIFSIVILTACNQEISKDDMIHDMTPPDPLNYFTLYAISENENIREHNDIENINQSLSDENRESLYHGGIIWARDTKVENVIWDYTGNFDIESYPTFLVFDTKGLTLQTTDIDEVEDFLSTNKPAWRE